MKLTDLLVMAAGAAILVITVFQSVSGQETCGGVGGVREQRTPRGVDNFYINLAAPAACSGYVNSFSFCYYRPLGDIQYVFTFALYRESNISEGTYNSVSRTFVVERTLSDIQSESEGRSFICVNLPVSETVPVEAGDMLGACVYDPSGMGVDELDIVSRVSQGDGNLLRDVASVCSPNTVPSTTMATDRSTRRFLNLNAEIVPPTETSSTMGTTMKTTESSTNTTGAPAGDGNGNGGAVAAAVIVVLIILVVSAVIVVLVVLLVKKQKSTKRHYSLQTTGGIQDGIDNIVYAVKPGNEMSSEYAEVGLMMAGPTSSNQPLYESPDNACDRHRPPFSDSGKSNEYTYAEVGPYEEVYHGNASASAYESPSTNVYESPLDEPAISYSKLLEKNKEEDIYGSVDPYTQPASQDDAVYAQLEMWKSPTIPLTDIKIEGHLGSGQFGSVERGQWKRSGTKPVDVALKTLNNTDSEDRLKFLQEAATMAQFRHPNVILLHGVLSRGDPMMLVVELASKGDLRNFLLSMRPDPGELVASNTSNLLLRFSQQVALGMQYLAAKGFVHRDLAARNVLVSTSEVCKISDFGMSRDLADESYYVSHGGMIPVKWTAPEAIHYKKYSTASDVWAYGCLLYEVWSIGHKPFEGVSNVNTIRLVDSGERLSPPPGCPKMIYELMILCWHQQTNPRPSFREIVLTLVGSEKMILNIPVKDSSTNPQAGVLGATLEAGENMYTDLQNRYLSDEVAI